MNSLLRALFRSTVASVTALCCLNLYLINQFYFHHRQGRENLSSQYQNKTFSKENITTLGDDLSNVEKIARATVEESSRENAVTSIMIKEDNFPNRTFLKDIKPFSSPSKIVTMYDSKLSNKSVTDSLAVSVGAHGESQQQKRELLRNRRERTINGWGIRSDRNAWHYLTQNRTKTGLEPKLKSEREKKKTCFLLHRI